MRPGIGIGIQGRHPNASDPAIQVGKSSEAGADPDITITIDANDSRADGRLNSDLNYYTITFPDDYLGGVDLFATARTGSGKIGTGVGASANLDIIFNIPAGMNIGANTSGTFGSIVWPWGGLQAGTKYELRENWDSSFINPTFGQWISDPSLVINLDTDKWDESILTRLNITINNSGNTIGAGGSGGWGGALSSGGDKNKGSGGGGGGQGLHPNWSGANIFESSDSYPLGDWLSGQGGSGWRTGATSGGYGADGAQGNLNAPGAKGAKSMTSAGASGAAGHAQAGGTAIYLKCNVASSTSGTTINIINQSGGRMYGGGGGGGGGHYGDGGDGGNMSTGGPSNIAPLGGGINAPGKGGWQGSILWVHTANLIVTNTITNQSSTAIAGWDGVWA